jgi:hypothetical protein
MFELDNRQIATLIWSGIIVASLVAWPKVRRTAWPALLDVLRSMAKWQIVIPFTVYFAYSIGVIALAGHLMLWHSSLFIDTVIIILFVGVPMFMNANTAKDADSLIKKTLRDAVGISALLVFYIGLEPFSLTGELVLLPVISLLSILSVAARKPEQKPAKRLIDGALVILGVWLMWRTTAVITSSWSNKEVHQSAEELLLSVLLPLALLPTVYVFALVMRYESLTYSLPNFNDKKRTPLYVWAAIIVHLNVRLGMLGNFIGLWRQQLAQTGNYSEASFCLREFKKAVHMRDRKLRSYREHLHKMTGVHGVDSEGLQLDRREYYESKTSLRSLLYMQMGQFKNIHHHYNPNFPVEVAVSGLPNDDHRIHMKVRGDNRAWSAWRQMPNGYCFGVGGTPHVDDVWFYDSVDQPKGYPSKSADGWTRSVSGSASAEWDYDDRPPEQITQPDYSR